MHFSSNLSPQITRFDIHFLISNLDSVAKASEAWIHSHLTALTNNHIQIRDLPSSIPRLRVLHLAHDVHAIVHLAEDDVLAI